jgi:hypothetical protein
MRRSLVVVALTAAMIAAQSSAALAATTYTVGQGAAVYVMGNTRVTPLRTTIDDDLFRLSTTSSGANRLPWALKVYGTSYSSAWISSNRNVQLGTSSPTYAWSNSCLPTWDTSAVMIAPYWDDILYGSDVEGIFTKSYTEAGAQKFLISWRGHHFATNEPIRAEVIFTRGSSNFEFRYADGFAGSATIGVQKRPSGPATQYTCNSGRNRVDAGLRLTFRYV